MVVVLFMVVVVVVVVDVALMVVVLLWLWLSLLLWMLFSWLLLCYGCGCRCCCCCRCCDVYGGDCFFLFGIGRFLKCAESMAVPPLFRSTSNCTYLYGGGIPQTGRPLLSTSRCLPERCSFDSKTPRTPAFQALNGGYEFY